MNTAADYRVTGIEIPALVGTRPFGFWHLDNLQLAKPEDRVQTSF